MSTFRERFELRTGAPWPASELADQPNLASVIKQMAEEIDELRKRVLPEDMEGE